MPFDHNREEWDHFDPKPDPKVVVWPTWFAMAIYIVAAILFGTLVLMIAIAAARAAPPPGVPLHPEWSDWFKRQWSIDHKQWCCDVSDGHLLTDDQWRERCRATETKALFGVFAGGQLVGVMAATKSEKDDRTVLWGWHS